MKIDSISFGRTYITSSLRYMSDENKKKLKSVYPLGQLYPVDLYLGANKKGDLTLSITQSSLYDYLLVNNLIKPDKENISAVKFIKAAENSFKNLHGNPYPVKKVTIPYLDYIPDDILPYYVADEIEEYAKENYKLIYS